mgnify:FL=1
MVDELLRVGLPHHNLEQVSGCDVVVEAVSDWSRSRLLNQVVGHGGIEMAE